MTEKIWDKIKKGVSAAAKEAEDQTKIGKRKLEIVSIDRKIKKNFSLIGERVYSLIKEEQPSTAIKKDEQIIKLIEEITNLENDRKAKEAEIEKIKTEQQ